MAIAVLVFVLTRDDTPGSDPSVPPTAPETSAVPEPASNTGSRTSTGATTTSAGIPDSAASTTTSTPGRFEVLSPEAVTYAEAMDGLKEMLQTMVVEISAASSDWDDREVTGARYDAVDAALVDVVQRVAALEQAVRDLAVPPAVQDRHEGSDGPVRQATQLVELAEAVLEGLRLPPPDDGSARRAALAEFINGVDGFNRSVDDLIRHVEENAPELGLTIRVATTTTTTTTRTSEDPPVSTTTTITTTTTATTATRPDAELLAEAEAIAYLEGLTRFRVMLAELVAAGNDASLAWDDNEATGVTYRATETALIEMRDRITALSNAVTDQRVPDALAGQDGENVVESAAGLVPPAEAVLEGLRIPAPEDGSARREALASLQSAAAAFDAAVEELARYVEENAGSLGDLPDDA